MIVHISGRNDLICAIDSGIQGNASNKNTDKCENLFGVAVWNPMVYEISSNFFRTVQQILNDLIGCFTRFKERCTVDLTKFNVVMP